MLYMLQYINTYHTMYQYICYNIPIHMLHYVNTYAKIYQNMCYIVLNTYLITQYFNVFEMLD